MPQRPRAHELESESRLALRSAIPSRWVFRDAPEDYGIDGEVEIFDLDSKATGALFKVQLKATDEADLRRALGVTVDVDRLTYALSLDLPVLLVLLHAPSARLFARWFHSFEVYPAEGQATVTMRLSEQDEWTESSPAALEADIDAYRAAARAALTLPIAVTVLANDGRASGFSIERIRLALRALISQQADVIRITAPPERGLVEVRLGDAEWLVRVAGVRKLILEELRSYDDVGAFCNDVLLAIAMAIARQGHRDVVVPLFVMTLPRSAHLGDWELVNEVGVILSAARRGDDLVRIAHALDVIGSEHADVAVDYLSAWILMAGHLSEAARAQWAEVCDSRVARATTANDSRRLGQAHYNRATFHRGERTYGDAVNDYDAAADADPEYLDRDYWQAERAGCLFEERRYEDSAKGYQQALELGADVDRVRPRYADALAFCGRYEDALNEFLAYQDETADPDPAWTVKIAALAWLCGQRSVLTQQRDEDGAEQVVHAHASDADEDEIIAAAEAALEKDAISTCAWWNWSGAHLRRGADVADHAGPLLIAAAFDGGDPVKWAEATIATFHVGDLLPLVAPIVAIAHFKCSDDYVQALDERAAEMVLIFRSTG